MNPVIPTEGQTVSLYKHLPTVSVFKNCTKCERVRFVFDFSFGTQNVHSRTGNGNLLSCRKASVQYCTIILNKYTL